MRRTNSWKKWVGIAALAIGMLGMGTTRGNAALSASTQTAKVAQQNPKYEAWLTKQVHHKLAMLPYYGIFDDLSYSINGTEVTLNGKVLNPVTKTDAVGSVKHIEGVTKVNDNIKVLPLSSMDNRIRRAEYRSIFGYSDLYRYAEGVNPSIHIIVENGHVTLVGYVDNQSDMQMVYMRANAVPGVFSVTNQLKIANTKTA
ncbi:MAG TPA: BON domain-containing protein [Candidatus Acidoferrales bacterium]|nr:BON domain-containing protein [Candidatus Acidoferrales bacterium]